MPKRILLENIKQNVKFEIATYATKSPIRLFEQFPARIILNQMLHLFTLADAQWYTTHYEIVINSTCNMIALFLL